MFSRRLVFWFVVLFISLAGLGRIYSDTCFSTSGSLSQSFPNVAVEKISLVKVKLQVRVSCLG
ncbi:hypothetical protein BVRB_2g037000 [Beta vulgaris subsp. vulgaris]|uniref:Uncharacterized protein n=1 Tax=Beta vulgaris subsp. vulgaris TaxID=3555 RepID=A0A0J8CV16_BETVV|nr:hypothetical protein BVRB_2g037000 [Beta vulgaris subsp. vulgaris]